MDENQHILREILIAHLGDKYSIQAFDLGDHFQIKITGKTSIHPGNVTNEYGDRLYEIMAADGFRITHTPHDWKMDCIWIIEREN